jgi:hypothetical protein
MSYKVGNKRWGSALFLECEYEEFLLNFAEDGSLVKCLDARLFHGRKQVIADEGGDSSAFLHKNN